MTVVCYPQISKRKAMVICEAFADGARSSGIDAHVCATAQPNLLTGDCFFYGMRESFAHLFAQCKAEGRTYFYADNSYFDCVREKQFRITRNAMQADGLNACWSGEGEARLRDLGVGIAPWREDGEHIVVCPQSSEYMRLCGWRGHWLTDVTAALAPHTSRPLRVRRKGEPKPLSEDLRDAWALVTHSSAAAVEALIAGIPVICTGRCAARWMGTGDLALIEFPPMPDGREEWARVLAENQWSVAEMRDGTAWRTLQ